MAWYLLVVGPLPTRAPSPAPLSPLAPGFSMRVRGIAVGPLLGRTLRGGLFALPSAGDRTEPGRVVELAVAGPGDLDDHDFLALAASLARLEHPGLPRVYEASVFGALRVTVMERVEGWPLRSLLGRRELVLDAERLGCLGREVAGALAALHDVGRDFGVGHGRLGLTHVVVERSGRARVCGFPLPMHVAGVLPDAMGLAGVVAAAAVGMTPDPRGVTPASLRGLALSLERPEFVVRLPLPLRRLLGSLLTLHPGGFLPSMSVLASAFEGLAGRRYPTFGAACGRALHHAVDGLAPGHRPTTGDAAHVATVLGSILPELAAAAPPVPDVELSDDSPSGRQPRLRLAGS